jgi:crossover junction endodeoxyribonuclease RuvC
VIFGIDPGLSGAIAVIGVGEPRVWAMPTMVISKTGFVKRAVDVNSLAALLRPYSMAAEFAVIERVNAFPGQGVGSMFSLGMSYWGVAGVIAALGVPLHLVAPAEWKKHFRLSNDKEMSRGLASRLYPGVDLHLKSDHGKAEALLIARYGMEILK